MGGEAVRFAESGDDHRAQKHRGKEQISGLREPLQRYLPSEEQKVSHHL